MTILEKLIGSSEQAIGLPEASLRKISRIKQTLMEARGAARIVGESVRRRLDDVQRLERHREQLVTPTSGKTMGGSGYGYKADHKDVVATDQKIAFAKDDAAALNERLAALEPKVQALASLLVQLEDFASSQVNKSVTAHPAIKLSVKPSDAVEEIERRRSAVRNIRAQLNAVECAPITSAEARAIVRADVDALAARGCPELLQVIERGHHVSWPKIQGHTELTTREDALALIAWINPDNLIAALDKEIAQLADDENALSSEQRAQKKSELLADLLMAEREEEMLIEAAEASGLEILRRVDVSPRAVLGVK